MTEKEKIAVIQIARMGDLLQSLPLLNALQKNYHITLIADSNIEKVAELSPSIDNIVPIDIKAVSQVASSMEISLSEKYIILKQYLESFSELSFPTVINLNYSALSCFISDILNPERKLGFYYSSYSRQINSDPWMTYLLTSTLTRRYNKINLADIFLYSAGNILTAEKGSRYLYKSSFSYNEAPTSDKPLIAIQSGAGDKKRLWPASYFAALCRMIRNEYDANIILTGNSKERDEAEKIKILADSRNIQNIAGKTDIKELAEYLKKCSLLITCDTGTMHLAASLNVPVLGLFFGPAFCFETGPFTENNYVIQSFESCAPCIESAPCSNRECVKSISPEVVYKVINSILRNKTDCLDEENTLGKTAIYKSIEDFFGITYKPLTRRITRYEDQLTDSLRLTWFNIMNRVDSGNHFLGNISGMNGQIGDEIFRNTIKKLEYLIYIRKKLFFSIPSPEKTHFEITEIDKRIDSLGSFAAVRHIINFFFRNIEKTISNGSPEEIISFQNNILKGLQGITQNSELIEKEHYEFI